MLQMFRDRDRAGAVPSRDLLPWSGEFAGKYLISAVQFLRLTGNTELTASLEAFVSELIRSQDAEGYLGPFERSQRMTGRDGHGDSLWDLWGQYHCMLGLYYWFRETGDRSALDACCRAADLFCRTFIDTGTRVIDAGAPEKNQASIHIFTLLYQETGNERFLRMARDIELDWRTGASGNYVLAHQGDEPFWRNPQPRWESLHDVEAIAELYFITGEQRYRQAFEQIWWSIVEGDRHNTGGFASRETATGNPYSPLPIETCATVAWMAMTVDMLRLTGDSRAADELELSTWNGAVASQDPRGRWWAYNTPMGGLSVEGVGEMGLPPPLAGQPSFLGERRPTAFDLHWQGRDGSPKLSCCSANGPRGLGTLSEWAAMTSATGIALNYYGASTFVVQSPSGVPVTLTQVTEYPVHGAIQLTVAPDVSEPFVLSLRIPGWSARTHILINGDAPAQPVRQGTYLNLERTWRHGDRIDLDLDLTPHVWVGGTKPSGATVPGTGEGRMSVYHGPLLMTYDPRFDVYAADQLPIIDPSRDPRPAESRFGNDAPLMLSRYFGSDGFEVTLCDFASAGRPVARHTSQSSPTMVPWQFARTDGSVIASPVFLRSDGSLLGLSHPNERRWGMEGDIVVFFSEDGRPSTRFTSVIVEHGRKICTGPFLFDPGMAHVLSELDLEYTRSVWRFGRLGGPTFAPIRLRPTGAIDGYRHDNEARWGLEDGLVVFYDRTGRPSTRFSSVLTQDGLMTLRGPSLLDPSIMHELRELDLEWVAGSPYVSWLPAPSGLRPAPFSRQNPLRVSWPP